jgi:hypothetical protein
MLILTPSHRISIARSVLSRYPTKLWDQSGIADLEIAGLRRRDGREQSAIGFEIEQRCAV